MYIAQLDEAHVYARPIVTEVSPLKGFNLRADLITETKWIPPGIVQGVILCGQILRADRTPSAG